MAGVEYQVTKVDPTDPETKGMVYQVHKVSEEVAATLGGKVYRARIIKDPSDPAVAGKVYQIVLIGDPSDPAVKGKVYNAILTGGSEAVVVGPAVSPLALDDAVADTMEYVKAYGGTQQGLPSGYTQLDYIESTGTQYINTGVTPNQDTSIETKAQLSVSSGVRFFAAYGPSSNAPYYGVGFSGSGKWVNQTNTSNQVTNVNADTDLHTIYKNKNILYVDGAQIDDSGSGDFTSSYSIYLLAANIGGSVSFISAGKMYYAKIWDGNTLVRNFVPCRNASNVVGMYDTINGVFYQNAGTGSFVAGSTVVPTPTAPMDIVSNNGVLKVRQNLWKGNYTDLGYLDETGAVIPTTGYMASDFIEIDQSKKYTFYEQIISAYTGNGMRICFYNSSKQKVGVRQGGEAKEINSYAYVAIPPAGAKYIRVSTGASANNVTSITLVEGEYDTTTIQGVVGSIYTDGTVETIEDTVGNTATAEMLLKVGNYQDVQSILDGVVTRNVGIKVLDGTEAWAPTLYPQTNAYRISWTGATATLGTIRYSGLFCTHFEDGGSASAQAPNKMFFANDLNINFPMTTDFDTIGKCLQYLADQYAAGTPVIILYPLATPTTESVAGQTLQVTDGDNTLEITQASLSGLELEAEYEKEGA